MNDRALAAVLLALAGLLLVRLGAIALLDPADLVTKLPDDQFYYLSLAREFAASGRWTFDGGISVTSGFHLLTAYFLVALFRLLGDGVVVGVVATLMASIASFAAAAVALRFLMRCFGLAAGVAALLIVPVAWWQNAVWVMEWPIVVLVSALAIARLQSACGQASNRDLAALFVLGLVGSLARADFGALPASFLAAALLAWWRTRDRGPTPAAAAWLSGAAVGVVLVLLHHTLVAGSPLPGSARIKAHWAEVAGYRPLDVARFLVQQHFQPAIALAGSAVTGAALLVVAGMTAVGAWRRRAAFAARDSSTLTLVGGAAIALGFYTLFYGANAAIQPWYTANVAVAALALLSFALWLVFNLIGDRLGRAAVLAAFAYAGAASLWALGQGWEHQRYWLDMVAEVRRFPPETRLGAWNAGLLRFASDRPIVNLDGVVNDSILRPAREGRLLDYLRETRIDLVADFAIMLDDSMMRRRGGYDDPAFRAALEPVLAVPGSAGIWGAGPLTLWRVRP